MAAHVWTGGNDHFEREKLNKQYLGRDNQNPDGRLGGDEYGELFPRVRGDEGDIGCICIWRIIKSFHFIIYFFGLLHQMIMILPVKEITKRISRFEYSHAQTIHEIYTPLYDCSYYDVIIIRTVITV